MTFLWRSYEDCMTHGASEELEKVRYATPSVTEIFLFRVPWMNSFKKSMSEACHINKFEYLLWVFSVQALNIR